MRTKTLAVHSIQKNMLATERKANELFILLATSKTLVIKAIDESAAYKIENTLHYYSSEGKENNSLDLDNYFELTII